MKHDEAIGALEALLPESSLEKLSFPPGWGGGFSSNKDGSTEIAEILQQFIDKRQNSGKTGATQKQSVEWIESVWLEEAQGRNSFGKWVIECAKNPDELRERVKKLKEERAAKRREQEKREAERQRREAEEAEKRRIEEEEAVARREAQRREREKKEAEKKRLEEQEAAARREAQRKAQKKREAERLKREAEEAEKRKIEEQEAEARREERRIERAQRKAEEAAVIAEQVAAITASMQERKEEKERIRQERKQKQREGPEAAERRELEERCAEYAEQRRRESEYAERRRSVDDATRRMVWTVVLGLGMSVALLCGFWGICHGFDVPLAKTGAVWPWCWWHIKFVVGLGLLLDIVISVTFVCQPGKRDSISKEYYEEGVSPLLFKLASVYVLSTLGMYIYALCHLFSALGFSFRAFGMGLLLAVEFLIVGLGGVLFHYLYNGLLWGRYEGD